MQVFGVAPTFDLTSVMTCWRERPHRCHRRVKLCRAFNGRNKEWERMIGTTPSRYRRAGRRRREIYVTGFRRERTRILSISITRTRIILSVCAVKCTGSVREIEYLSYRESLEERAIASERVAAAALAPRGTDHRSSSSSIYRNRASSVIAIRIRLARLNPLRIFSSGFDCRISREKRRSLYRLSRLAEFLVSNLDGRIIFRRTRFVFSAKSSERKWWMFINRISYLTWKCVVRMDEWERKRVRKKERKNVSDAVRVRWEWERQARDRKRIRVSDERW